ncbi:MAG: flagellar hook-length control protein FliK [Chlamydiia bacterium]|nr:flagellar hook-length control protein FliK [Chlamydiia bacterium]
MEDGIQFVSKPKGAIGGLDTSKQALGILDDMSQSFEQRLNDAQDRQKKGANLADGKQKTATPKKQEQRAEPSDAPRTQVNDQSESAAPAKQPEASDEDTALPLTDTLEQLSDDQDIEPPQVAAADTPRSERQDESEAEDLDSETAVAEVVAAPIQQQEQASAPVALVLEDKVAFEAEADAPAPLEGTEIEVKQAPTRPTTEAEQAPLAPEAKESKASGFRLDNPLRVEDSAEDDLDEVDDGKEPDAPPEEAGADDSDQSIPAPTDEKAAPATPKVNSHIPNQQADSVLATTQRQAAKPKGTTPVPQLELREQSKLEEEVPEDFHAISAESKEVTVKLSKDESESILEGLRNIASQSQVQAPKVDQVSQRMLDGLKATQSSLAKDIEAAKGSSEESNGVSRLANSELRQAAESQLTERARFDNPRMEQLKNRVIQQVRVQIRGAFKGKASEIRLQLQPEMLGKVKVKLLLEANAAKASFIVDNQTVKEVLQRSVQTLQQSLAEQGIDVTEIEVTVADQHSGQSDGHAQSGDDQATIRDFVASFRLMEQKEQDSSEGAAEVMDEDAVGLNVVV